MKLIRSGLGLATVLAICAVQFFFGTPAYASSVSRAIPASVTTTTPLYVDCKQHPSAAIAKNWAKYHICQYSGISNTAATPNGVSQGNCGTVTNTLVNQGGGVGRSIVVVSVPWYSGGMRTAYYAGSFFSDSGLSGNVSDGTTSFTFNWTSPKNYYMDTGLATVIITAEGAQTLLLGNCTLANPIAASANITR